MSHKFLDMFRDELDRLLILATCGDACATEIERLNSLLRDHEELRSHAASVLCDEALLREELQVQCAADLLRPEASSTAVLGALLKGQKDGTASQAEHSRLRRLLFSTRLFAAGLAACVVAVALVGIILFPRSTVAPMPLESTDDGVAVLTQVVAVVWEQESQPKIGDTIPLSVLQLKSGLVQIEFYSGASMLLEGPAELEVLSADRCFCHRGKLRVTVPRSAQGFTVLSPEIEAVDLGTEFGVEVFSQGKTQVHVFDGKVELYPPGTQRAAEGRIELYAGSGQHIERSGDSYAITADPQAFVSMEELKLRRDEEVAHRNALWRQHMLAMMQDRRLVALYDFEQDQELDRVLHNHGMNGRSLDGAIVGCEWSEGRWPGKDALEFKRPGDRVCINVPGEYDALTLAGWIRVDGLDRDYSSILMTNGWEVGEIHWQILRSGQIKLGICHLEVPEMIQGRLSEGFDYDSPVVWDLARTGQWIHVAVVVDNNSGFVTHYANGRVLSREPLQRKVKLRLGDAQIGNWRPRRNPEIPIRSFNGRIDELMIVGDALTHEEIQSLYQKGKPTGITGNSPIDKK